MNIPDDILSPSERAALTLRSLFQSRGYARYELNKFEEYDLYAQNREFFGGDIITFTGAGGRLMALRPDVTLSVVKNARLSDSGVNRVYYHANVYRRSGLAREFKEFAQCGVECIGDVDVDGMSEVVALAWDSLAALGSRCIIDVSHVGLAAGILNGAGLPQNIVAELLQRLGEKNAPAVAHIADEHALDARRKNALLTLAEHYGAFEDVRGVFAPYADNAETQAALTELSEVVRRVRQRCPDADIRADFSLSQDMSYYTGIIFTGYVEGYASPVLAGGRYDGLLRKFGRDAGAIGFSVYVDMLDRSGVRS